MYTIYLLFFGRAKDQPDVNLVHDLQFSLLLQGRAAVSEQHEHHWLRGYEGRCGGLAQCGWNSPGDSKGSILMELHYDFLLCLYGGHG